MWNNASTVARSLLDPERSLESLAAAYYQATDLDPTEAVLVTQGEGEDQEQFFARLVGFDFDGGVRWERVSSVGPVRRLLRRFLRSIW